MASRHLLAATLAAALGALGSVPAHAQLDRAMEAQNIRNGNFGDKAAAGDYIRRGDPNSPTVRNDPRVRESERAARQEERYQRGNDRRYDNGRYERAPVARDYRGGAPSRAWHRGDRLPPEYRGRQYIVDDWRGHRLSAPPRGYQWVQSGPNYLLVAIATGLIAQVLLNQ